MGPVKGPRHLPTEKCVFRALNEQRAVHVGGGLGIRGGGGGVLFMKNTIITSRSVEGTTGLKQIWGLGREEHYGCFKNRTVSLARRLAQKTPALSPKVHTYTNNTSTTHVDPQKHTWAMR